MFSHVTMGTHDLERAVSFYDATLAPLGIARVPEKYSNWAAWQRPGEESKFWVGLPYNQLPASWGNGCMVAFEAPSRAAVNDAHAAALARGGEDEGPPGHTLTVLKRVNGTWLLARDANLLVPVQRSST